MNENNLEMPKIAVCLTTFLRDELLFKTMKSILNVYQENLIILVGDQGHPTKEKKEYFDKFVNDIYSPNVVYFQLPFDCGLSCARNTLVEHAKDLGCKYCLITADSIEFTFTMSLINEATILLEWMSKCGILGFDLQNRFPYEFDMELVEGNYFYLKKPTREICGVDNPVAKLIQCDIVKNFFLAKTQALLDSPWDEELKVCEHEDFFYRFKQTKWTVAWTDLCSAKYIDCKPVEYNKYRKRMYNIYRRKLQEKYCIKGWTKYEKKSNK